MRRSGSVCPATVAALVAFVALAALPAGAKAQASPLVMEVRGGVAAPVSSFTDAEPGRSFGLALVLSGAGRRATSVGFSQHRFGCEPLGCGPEGTYTATGFDVGFRFDLRTRGAVIPWVRAGVVTTQVEVPSAVASGDGLSSLGLGFEAGAGLYIGASSPLALVPGIRFTAVNTELPGGDRLRMRYIVADIALALAF